MSGIPLGLIVESAVAVLLVLTIGYCIVLNNRLKRLHSDREALKQMVADLVQATDMANNAIKELRQTASEADTVLDSRLKEADRFALELANHVQAGRSIMERIARVSEMARRSQALSGAADALPAAEKAKGAQAALDRLTAHKQRRETAA